MDRYQLAKLVQWAQECSAEGLKSRKRLQKVVYLLQCAGCPLDADYSLHYYGPYSGEVAQITDELVHAGLLVEEQTQNPVGKQFNYKLRGLAADSLGVFEATPTGHDARQRLAPFEERAKQLLELGLSELEYAATVAYFHQKETNWKSAFQKLCDFKRLSPDSCAAQSALRLAEQVVK